MVQLFEFLEGNWQAIPAFIIFTSITNHLLSFSLDANIRVACLNFLSNCRNTTLGWASQLKHKVQQSTDTTSRDLFGSKAAIASLVCADSFNVDDEELSKLLQTPELASVFFQICITIQENERLLSKDSSDRIMLDRWKRLCHKVQNVITQDLTIACNGSLDEGILACWPGFIKGGSWERYSNYSPWLIYDLPATNDEDGFAGQVQFNILSGQLLVNGLPLNRLPELYENNDVYKKLFGLSIMEVLPSTIPGMTFSSKSEYAGYAFQFGMESHGDQKKLRIRARKGGREFELVPGFCFQKNFPVPFVSDHFHWYDIQSHAIHVRHHDNPWPHDGAIWTLTKIAPSHDNSDAKETPSQNRWEAERENQSLIDLKSPTGTTLEKVFAHVEHGNWMQIVLKRGSGEIEIGLPRLRVGFTAKEGGTEITSKQHRNMCIDSNQSFGALTGLNDRLVLRNSSSQPERMVLIPSGKVSYTLKLGYTHVTIDRASVKNSQIYHIDNMLGRLVDNGSPESKLFLAHLHALTSFCLPDLLTSRTGTEQALDILGSAAIRSFDRWSRKSLDLLVSLSSLTPEREYYPRNESVMQTVSWNLNLSTLAQHGRFRKLVSDIFNLAKQSEFFYDESSSAVPKLRSCNANLLRRDDIRSSTFRVDGYGAESYSQEHDLVYTGRDHWEDPARAKRVLTISHAVNNKSLETLNFSFATSIMGELWQLLDKHGGTMGRSAGFVQDKKLLTYSTDWINVVSQLKEKLVPLHNLLSDETQTLNRFHIALWLSTLAFQGGVSQLLIYVMAAFYLHPKLNGLDMAVLPPATRFQLSAGTSVQRDDLEVAVSQSWKDLEQCPENDMEKLRSEKFDAFDNEEERLEKIIALKKRKHEALKKKRVAVENEFLRGLIAQWPCRKPNIPGNTGLSYTWDNYLMMDPAMNRINEIFKTRYDNRCFKEYLSKIDAILRQLPYQTLNTPPPSRRKMSGGKVSQHGHIKISDAFLVSGPEANAIQNTSKNCEPDVGIVSKHNDEPLRLSGLLKTLKDSSASKFEAQYVKELEDSCNALISTRRCVKTGDVRNISRVCDTLEAHLHQCKDEVKTQYFVLVRAALGVNGSRTDPEIFRMFPDMHQRPRICPSFFLQQLRQRNWNTLSHEWKESIVQYAVGITKLQQAHRMLRFARTSNTTKLIDELENHGHTNWIPADDPESLLLEVESDIMIREVQVAIASEMRSPSTNSNAVMQLNMGEGKSSVIIPMVAARLANESNLVRVIVAKPQAQQMHEMLVVKLGGLVNRPVFHAPFSRSVKLGEKEAKTLHRLFEQCIQQGGVLLVQPEHILSLKLMMTEKAYSGGTAICRLIGATHDLLRERSRDIIDESDENLSVKFELVYTMGTQQHVDHSPFRWVCIQNVLTIFRGLIGKFGALYPDAFEVARTSEGKGGFPRTRILQQSRCGSLVTDIARHVCRSGLAGLPLAIESSTFQSACLSYMTKSYPTAEELSLIEKSEYGTGILGNNLGLLRGLCAGGILEFVFTQKRWKVDYGLHSRPCSGYKAGCTIPS